VRWLPRMHQPSVKSVAWRRELLHTLAAEMIMNGHRGLLVVLSLAALAGCGGGGDSGSSGGGGGGGGGGGTPLPNHTVTAADTAENSARITNLNAFRSASGGTALPTVTSHNALIISAVRHAGWQAIDDITQAGANLDHGEPRSNALFSDDDFGERVRKGNGGTHLSPASYYEDIASRAGSAAITQLWNSVYHRLPMMRHRASRVGYGDMTLARSDYPTAGVPADDEWGNTPDGSGYATLNWQQLAAPAITLSYWPANGTSGVPHTFNSNSEAPDPVASRNQVGCPIHFIFADTAGTFTSINVTLITGGTTHIPMIALVGNAGPSGAAGDVTSVTADTAYLDEGELFLIPTPTVVSDGLSPNTPYTLSGSVTLNSVVITLPNVTYTTAP